ncbi:MAG: hypothetical protein JXR22_11980, partial [Prolixibacteraceae bacterium]|nr:hypothetical protein [Prolixibacteraceae bacterium]
MKPIRIFLFILMILLITELYKHRSFFDTKVVGELPELMPVQQLSDDEYLLAETLEVEILDTLPAAITHLSSFFEGADPF